MRLCGAAPPSPYGRLRTPRALSFGASLSWRALGGRSGAKRRLSRVGSRRGPPPSALPDMGVPSPGRSPSALFPGSTLRAPLGPGPPANRGSSLSLGESGTPPPTLAPSALPSAPPKGGLPFLLQFAVKFHQDFSSTTRTATRLQEETKARYPGTRRRRQEQHPCSWEHRTRAAAWLLGHRTRAAAWFIIVLAD